VNKWARAFFWARKEEVNGGQCLVAWDKCKPTCFGGLGVDDLKLHGLALCIRWEWLRRSGVNRAWNGLPMIEDAPATEAFHGMVHIR
jgi:hypothetical protein